MRNIKEYREHGALSVNSYRNNKLIASGMVLIFLLSTIPMTVSSTLLNTDYISRFDVSPSYINLGMETNIEVEIIQSYGVNLDNYMVTVTAPDDTEFSAWFNFTSVGSMSKSFGDDSSGFMTMVEQIGIYDIVLEYFDGANFTTVASNELSVTDVLVVIPVPHAPANTWAETHSCPITSEFERGNSIMMRAETLFLSTGEPVQRNATITTVTMDIPGVKLRDPLAADDAPDNEKYPQVTTMYLGHGGWGWQKRMVTLWDSAHGSFQAILNATDVYGNNGQGTRTLRIVQSRLDVHMQTLNGTTPQTDFEVGEAVNFVVNATYKDRGKTHGYEYHGPNDWGYLPMNTTRGDYVRITLGSGYDPVIGEFTSDIAELNLTYDDATMMWIGSYNVMEANSDVTAKVEAYDTAPGTPNSGFTYMNLAFVEPLIVTKTETKYVNQTVNNTVEIPVEIEKSTGFETPLVAGLAIIMLIVGLAVGMILFRKGKNKQVPLQDEMDAPPKE